jgi:YVTN family beta-propeller protein
VGLCYDSAASRVYVSNYASNSISVIDGASNAVVASVETPYTPDRLCYSGPNNYVYCAMPNAGQVAVISCAAESIIGVVQVGAGPWALCYNPVANRVYTADLFGGTVSVLRGSLGIEESGSAYGPRPGSAATVVRGVFWLPRDMTELPGNSGRVPGPALLDIAGRKVLDLGPGANDISHLAPGVYFVRVEPQASGCKPQAVRRAVVTR